MKNYFVYWALALIFFSCKKNDFVGDEMTVIKDCTGSYLKFNSLDYQVCNEKTLDKYSDGQMVYATFDKVNECHELDNKIVCMMYHENEGWVWVNDIRAK